MSIDVKTLLTKLREERDALDAAISELELSEPGQGESGDDLFPDDGGALH